MAWYGKGPERVKSFSLYKELEGKYVETLKRLILQKEAGIAVLARELSSLHAEPAQGDAKHHSTQGLHKVTQKKTHQQARHSRTRT